MNNSTQQSTRRNDGYMQTLTRTTGRELDAWVSATATLESIRLIELGARAGLVCQLTGMDKAVAIRLYRQVHGQSSPPGQSPFTDTWYLKNEDRLFQATLIWRLFQRFAQEDLLTAQTLISVYEGYRQIIEEPLLDITRTVFVPQLTRMKSWREQGCQRCHARYITPSGNNAVLCPACRLYQRYRCHSCGTSVQNKRKGRHRSSCPGCGLALPQ